MSEEFESCGLRLATMISRDVIALYKDFKKMLPIILEYHDNFNTDEVIKNFYEIVYDAPLFELCKFLSGGKENFSMMEGEFEEEIKNLVEKVNEKFGSSFTLEEVMEVGK